MNEDQKRLHAAIVNGGSAFYNGEIHTTAHALDAAFGKTDDKSTLVASLVAPTADHPADGLESENLNALRTLAKSEGAELEGSTKAEVIASIRAHRKAKAEQDADGLDEQSLNELRETAAKEGLDLSGEDDRDQALVALRAHRAPTGI